MCMVTCSPTRPPSSAATCTVGTEFGCFTRTLGKKMIPLEIIIVKRDSCQADAVFPFNLGLLLVSARLRSYTENPLTVRMAPSPQTMSARNNGMHLDDEMDLRPTSARTARFASALYPAALFLSALLLFAIQPMFTKMVLPRIGGAAAVWSVAMGFFQAALLLGD